MNLFQEAIDKNELLLFAIGKGNYFIVDREYGEHFIHGSWVNHIMPLMENRGEEYVNKFVGKMMDEVLSTKELSLTVKNDVLLYHFYVYYYFKEQGRIKTNALITINKQLKESLFEYQHYLQESENAKSVAVTNALSLIQSRGGLI